MISKSCGGRGILKTVFIRVTVITVNLILNLNLAEVINVVKKLHGRQCLIQSSGEKVDQIMTNQFNVVFVVHAVKGILTEFYNFGSRRRISSDYTGQNHRVSWEGDFVIRNYRIFGDHGTIPDKR